MKSSYLYSAAITSNTLEKNKGENLPHWSSKNAIYHISFRLHDSIPQSKREELIQERIKIKEILKSTNRELTENEWEKFQYLYSEKIETYLDSGYGNCYLANPKIAEMVSKTLKFYDEKKYRLYTWCIMPNHVHVIFEIMLENSASPNLKSMGEILHSWKSYTANQAKKILNLPGPFWQKDYYNHIIRTKKEYHFQMKYVWENPEKANLKNFHWRWKRPE